MLSLFLRRPKAAKTAHCRLVRHSSPLVPVMQGAYRCESLYTYYELHSVSGIARSSEITGKQLFLCEAQTAQLPWKSSKL